jgi:hypothetical protein
VNFGNKQLRDTSLAFTCARQIPTIPTPEPTSKQALLANNSGNDKTNSDRNRLDGQMEHPVSPSSMFNEQCSGITNFLDLGQLGCLYEPNPHNKSAKHISIVTTNNKQTHTTKT